MKPPPHSCRPRRRQHGVATLAVVMVLFFIIAMTAAYTSRNMIFEQKTSANQYRSTLASEAAEAGIEWTLAQLNGGLVNDNCGSVAPTKSFQQRYFRINAVTGLVENARVAPPPPAPAVAASAPDRWPACVVDGAVVAGVSQWSWNNPAHCACPDDAAVTPGAVGGSDIHPAFRVWFAYPPPYQYQPALPPSPPTRPGVVALQVNGCTKLPAGGERCLDLDPQGDVGDGLSTLRVLLALRSGLVAPPPAAVTARVDVSPAAAPVPRLRVVNDADLRTNGVTLTAGGDVKDGGIKSKARVDSVSLPGVPGEVAIVDGDSKLSLLGIEAAGGLDANERMFVTTFGMTRQTYREQPGLRRCAAPCTAAAINALLAQNPGRVIWVDGDLALEANAAVGSINVPVLLVVNGDTLTLGDNVNIVGFVYLTGGAAGAVATIELPDSAVSITGALVSEKSLATSGAGAASQLTVTYHPAVLNTLRTGYGSWVRVPGSWRDFRE